jgi:site-specific DNA-methyltransferase (adenine-specific)
MLCWCAAEALPIRRRCGHIEPVDVSSGQAAADPWLVWALAQINATPLGGVPKKGADRGIDGKITFTDANGKLETVLVSVKSGHVQVSDVRDLRGTIEREKAASGVLVTSEEPTGPMRDEAVRAGLYRSHLWNRD